MNTGDRCPRCQTEKSWAIRRGKRRCVSCRYEWRPGPLPLRLTRRQWSALVRYFLLGLSSAQIAHVTGLERRRVLRALLQIRQRLACDVPTVFSGIVEVDETYLGGHWRNRRHWVRGGPPGRGTVMKTPVMGILCRGGTCGRRSCPISAVRRGRHWCGGVCIRARLSAPIRWVAIRDRRPGVCPSPRRSRPGPVSQWAQYPYQRPGGLPGLSETPTRGQGGHPPGPLAVVSGRRCVAVHPSRRIAQDPATPRVEIV